MTFPVGPVLPHNQTTTEPTGITAPPGFNLAPTKVKLKPPPKPKATQAKPQSALDKWLAGDTTYQQQLAELNQEKSAYQNNVNQQNNITNRDFASTQRQMNTQGNLDRQNQQYDFAGRGILHSGVYAKALGDYNTDFQTKMNNLIQGKTDTINTAQSNLNDFLRQIALNQNTAKQDAIRRRQQELGI